MIHKIIKIILVLLFMIIIFVFSSDKADTSTKKSDGVIIKISETFLGHKLSIKERDIYTSKYVKIVRKGAHFTIYFLLGLSFISLLQEYMIIDKKSLIYTIIFIFIYACSDEVHQLFVSGRSGEVLDVFIDTLGGSISSFIYYLIRRVKHE